MRRVITALSLALFTDRGRRRRPRLDPWVDDMRRRVIKSHARRYRGEKTSFASPREADAREREREDEEK